MNLNLLTSRNRLFIGFLFILFICLIVLFINYFLKESQLQMKNELLVEQNLLLEMQKINRIGLNSDIEGAFYFLSNTDQQKNEHLVKYEKVVQTLNLEIENFRRLLIRPNNILLLSNFQISLNKDLQDNERAFQLEKEGHVDEARAMFMELHFKEVNKQLSSMREQQRQLIEEKQRSIERKDFMIQQANTVMTVAFILITIALGWILSRKIKLEHHLNTQKQFYQNTSHELKTPLMSIQGYAQAILDGTIQGEKVGDSLKVIISESDRLKRLVTDIILLSKLENDKASFGWQAVPVEYLIDESIFRMYPLLKEKGVNVEIHPTYLTDSRSLLVKVDSEKCLQSFLNILSNALRYSVHVIDISILEKRNQVWIDIKDDGEGIPENDLANLFQRFFKGKNGENGLGLAISRAIIEQSGGNIKAWNHKDGGAVFRIILPTINE